MRIIINGQELDFPETMTIKQLAEWMQSEYPGKVLKAVTEDKRG